MAWAAAGQAGGSVASSLIEAFSKREAAKEAGKPRAAYSPPSSQEKDFRQGLRDIFGSAAGVTGAGVGQLAMIMPELYRLLGYEPTIVDRTADAAAAQQEVNDLQARLADLKDKKAKGRRGPDNKAKQKNLARIKKEIKLITRELADRQENLTQLQSQPIQITGLTPISAEGRTATGARQMVDLTTQQAIEALQGKVETDPTLLREFEEEEGRLRETLRRQLGPGYETSTAGIQALNDFQRKKKESIAGYTRDLAASLSDRALGGEATLSDLLSARLNQIVFPSGQTQSAGINLANISQSGLGIQQLLQQERELKYPGIGSSGLASFGPIAAQGGAAVGELAQGLSDWYRSKKQPTQSTGYQMT